MSPAETDEPGRQPAIPTHRLLVCCPVCGAGLGETAEVRRGMPVAALDGEPLGVVAAVVWACRRRRATHLLLGEIPPTAVYHLVPLRLIAAIEQQMVRLRATRQEVERLPVHQPEWHNK